MIQQDESKQAHNHTPISINPSVVAIGKESEPLRMSEAIESLNLAESSETPTEEYIEEIPHAPEITEEMRQAGVRHPTTSVIINGREFKFPMALEEVSDGLKEPSTSGKHWLALFIEYILAKLGFKIVDKKGNSQVVRR
ncbi:hypothetical protein COU88_02385 [Candidatus Roizmanbacteria bacterium CG10_big_fil_rev_8_21_14_0_10_39_6]|uniref:Uncharacterized protein n=1 Tax=Candidatus Roizmanbacteria bacterium CG10_big_fil_rev_8_21_14_0_10_39_6 TaxID=1974853 RepID=A0A2M8KSM3_9BACT|nr:MAG: hypothetical protein COU88_02385 [Candidatus Roizmanbacteria bacterium CG10_big_fil_rev_8_21_14_0_10_39_6]